ncbi:MAG: FAD-dependent oxidoreductase [Myxococcales bacterium]|nr:FAD-dependent oxidoreductase [Myxococcales bacterium]
MKHVEYLIVGAGVSGLSFANFVPRSANWLCLERQKEPGGYCRTVKQDGFVWDMSGHFFHFRHPRIEQYLVHRMNADEVATIRKSSSILYKGRRIEFPFQKNIHQLPLDEFLECLYDLYFRPHNMEVNTFLDMLYARLGQGIVEKFLRPYNEKLYACSLSSLDKEAMGRFFPHADIADIIRNMRFPDAASYNATFTYPRGGAIEYIRALLKDIDDVRIHYDESLESIDTSASIAYTSKQAIRYEHVVSSMPWNRLLEVCHVPHDSSLYTYNKVLVFNLGFDKKGQETDHWIYIPEPHFCFYRVGFYDNIFATERMSLYVEIGLKADVFVDVSVWLPRVLHDLQVAGITQDHQLLSYHWAVLDPAYVHINNHSQHDFWEKRAILEQQGVYSIGRYGGWTYCSIEDNIVEASQLAHRLSGLKSDVFVGEPVASQ